MRSEFSVRSGRAEAGDRRANQTWMASAQSGGIHTEPARGRWTKTLDEDVTARDQRIEHRMRLRRPQVERHASLVPTQNLEISSIRDPAHAVAAARILDLDDLCAEIRQEQRRIRAPQQPRQIENSNAAQGLTHACAVCCG